MAHFLALVVTATPQDLAAALRPFALGSGDSQEQPHFVFVDDRHADRDPATGARGYWRNPRGQWDGWVLGGNWHWILDDGPWPHAPETAANQRSRADFDLWLTRTPERLEYVFALVSGDLWLEAQPSFRPSWQTQLHNHLRALPPTSWISAVDCHC